MIYPSKDNITYINKRDRTPANDNQPIFNGTYCKECEKVSMPTTCCTNCGARLNATV